MVVQRQRPTSPDAVLKTIAPDREQRVLAVACLFTWDWLADWWAREGLPCVLGQALSMKAMPGGTATNDKLDAQKMAGLLRGGLLPQASGSPAEMRATRDRRRRPLMRKRAALLTHVQHTNCQDHGPEMGKTSASKATRAGGAARCPAPAVPQSLAVDRALLDSDDQRLQALELTMVTTATPQEATTRYVLQTVPGSGTILRLVLLEAMHDLARFPRGQDGGSSGRLVTGAQAAAGQRAGPAGPKIGHADLTWAFSEAAVLFLRHHPGGQTSLAR